MRAIVVLPGKPGARIVERPEPEIHAPDEVKMQVLQVGICGTDREQAEGGRALLPEGQQDLVIGHEMLGRVVQVGSEVRRVAPGDYAVFTVRRGCGKCMPCTMCRPDMCRTGQYKERGIWGLDGYQTEFVVDQERWAVRVPPELPRLGVLAEPMSIVEKAIDEAVTIQFARLPDAQVTPHWLFSKRCLVTGLGPIGLLAAVILRLRGAEVWGMDIVDEGTARPQWLKSLGGRYLDGRQVTALDLARKIGPMDLIVEATGAPKLTFDLLDALTPGGIHVLTGLPGGQALTEIPGAQLVRDVVLRNILMVGTVNAARDHFQMGVDDLLLAKHRWPEQMERLISHRFPAGQFEQALVARPGEEIKSVVEWTIAAAA